MLAGVALHGFNGAPRPFRRRRAVQERKGNEERHAGDDACLGSFVFVVCALMTLCTEWYQQGYCLVEEEKIKVEWRVHLYTLPVQ